MVTMIVVTWVTEAVVPPLNVATVYLVAMLMDGPKVVNHDEGRYLPRYN